MEERRKKSAALVFAAHTKKASFCGHEEKCQKPACPIVCLYRHVPSVTDPIDSNQVESCDRLFPGGRFSLRRLAAVVCPSSVFGRKFCVWSICITRMNFCVFLRLTRRFTSAARSVFRMWVVVSFPCWFCRGDNVGENHQTSLAPFFLGCLWWVRLFLKSKTTPGGQGKVAHVSFTHRNLYSIHE